MPRPSHAPWLNRPNIWLGVQITNLFIIYHLLPPVTSFLLCLNTVLSALFSNTLSLRPYLNVSKQVSQLYQATVKLQFCYLYDFTQYDIRLQEIMHRMVARKNKCNPVMYFFVHAIFILIYPSTKKNSTILCSFSASLVPSDLLYSH